MSLSIWIRDPELREEMRGVLAARRPTDSGVDLLCPAMMVEPGLGQSIPLGVVVAAKTILGEPAPCLLLPRSSLSGTPLRLSNSIGLIDAGYRGEVLAKVDTTIPYPLAQGRRLFQLVQHSFLPFVKVTLVDRLEDLPPAPDSRGSGGFGSTGQ